MLNQTTPNRELQRRWLLDLRRRNLRPRTIESYDERVDLLRRWAGERTMLSLSTDDLERFLDGRGRAASTRHAYIAALRSLYRWALDHGLIVDDPTRHLAKPVVRPGRPRPLADDEMARGLAEADAQTRVILLLGAVAGLRASEMANLRVEDVDLSRRMLEVVLGKGAKSRFVPIHPVLAEALRTLPMPARGHVLRDRYGRALDRHKILYRVRKVLPASSHRLRHTAGTWLYQACHDVLTVATVLGHENLNTTQVYSRVDLAHVAAVVDAIKGPGRWN